MGFIQGIDRSQVQLLPLSVDEYILEDAPVRIIDKFVEHLDLSGLGLSRPVAPDRGRPAYNPRTLLKLYIYGYLNCIRSSRRLEVECLRNLEVIWLMQGLHPDFKTISEFRRHNAGVFAKVLLEFNLMCRALNVFSAQLIAIDGAKFRANNAFEKSFNEKQLHLFIGNLEKGIAHYMTLLDQADVEAEGDSGEIDKRGSDESIETFRKKLATLESRKEHLQDLLETLKESPRNDVSTTDPDSRRLTNGRQGGTQIGYNVQVAVDGKHGLIVAQDVVDATNDYHQLGGMTKSALSFLQQVEPQTEEEEGCEDRQEGAAATEVQSQAAEDESAGEYMLKVLADCGYSEADQLAVCHLLGVETYVPTPQPAVRRNEAGEVMFPKSDFKYDEERDSYTCPNGSELRNVGERHYRGHLSHRYHTNDCLRCPLKAQCTTSRFRHLDRRPNEPYIHQAKQRFADAPEMKRLRQALVEKVFGTMRTWGFDEFLLRGMLKVQAEFSLSSLAYNFRRCLNIVGASRMIECFSNA